MWYTERNLGALSLNKHNALGKTQNQYQSTNFLLTLKHNFGKILS